MRECVLASVCVLLWPFLGRGGRSCAITLSFFLLVVAVSVCVAALRMDGRTSLPALQSVCKRGTKASERDSVLILLLRSFPLLLRPLSMCALSSGSLSLSLEEARAL